MEKLCVCLVVSVEFRTFFFFVKKKGISFFDCFKGDNDLNAFLDHRFLFLEQLWTHKKDNLLMYVNRWKKFINGESND